MKLGKYIGRVKVRLTAFLVPYKFHLITKTWAIDYWAEDVVSQSRIGFDNQLWTNACKAHAWSTIANVVYWEVYYMQKLSTIKQSDNSSPLCIVNRNVGLCTIPSL